MERVCMALFDRSAGGNERLGQYLSAEDTLPVFLGAAPAEQVDLDRFQVEQVKDIF